MNDSRRVRRQRTDAGDGASTYQGKSCADVGLMCAYPGVGDGTADGCFATAVMWCRGDGGIGDGGLDGGAGTWTVAQ